MTFTIFEFEDTTRAETGPKAKPSLYSNPGVPTRVRSLKRATPSLTVTVAFSSEPSPSSTVIEAVTTVELSVVARFPYWS